MKRTKRVHHDLGLKLRGCFCVLVAVCLQRSGRMLLMCGRFTQATVLACLLSTRTTQPIIAAVLLICVFPKALAALCSNSS